jgi:hypothetical protein
MIKPCNKEGFSEIMMSTLTASTADRELPASAETQERVTLRRPTIDVSIFIRQPAAVTDCRRVSRRGYSCYALWDLATSTISSPACL